MGSLIALLAACAFFACILGMIKPKLVAHWGNRSRIDVLKVYPLCFILLIGIGTLVTPQGELASQTATPPQTQQASPAKWYEGGTLHKNNGAAWAAATYQNKLATCADFVTATSHTIDPVGSKELVDCLDKTFSDATTHNLRIAEAAAMCLTLMGKAPK